MFKTRNTKEVNSYLQKIRKPMYPKNKLVGGNKGQVRRKNASNAFKEVADTETEQADGSDQGGSRTDTEAEQADGSEQGGSRTDTEAEQADQGSDQGGSRTDMEAEQADQGSDQGGSRIEEEIIDVQAEEKKGETKRRQRRETFRLPAALAKKKKNILEMAGSNDLLKECIEYYIAEREEDRRRADIMYSEMKDRVRYLTEKLNATEKKVEGLQCKQPKMSEVQAAEKLAKLPWHDMKDMRYALKYHEKEIITFVNGTVMPGHATWEKEVIRVLMTEDLKGRQLYSGPSSRCLGNEVQVKMGIQVFKQPTQLAALAFRLIRDNDKIKNKKDSQNKWRRVFESSLRKRRYKEIFKLADLALNHSDEIQGEVACILILNDLAHNEGGITEAAPDMTDDSEMSAWLTRHRDPVLRAAQKQANIADGEVTYRRLIESNLRTDMTVLSLLRNHEKLLAGESIDVLEEDY